MTVNMGVLLICFILWSVVDYFSVRILCDHFLLFNRPEGKRYNNYWLIWTFIISILYCYTKYTNVTTPPVQFSLAVVLGLLSYPLYYLRLVPFLWSGFGVSSRLLLFYFFYQTVIASTSFLLQIIILPSFSYSKEYNGIGDIFEFGSAALVFLIILILYYFKRSRNIQLWIRGLTSFDYITIIFPLYSISLLGTTIFSFYDSVLLETLVVISFFLLIAFIFRFLFVKDKVTTTSSVLDILQKQTEKLSDYCDELNNNIIKERQFRHDTKNLLLSLKIFMDEREIDQARDFVNSLGIMYQKTSRSFDTGSNLFDSLLASKETEATEMNISFSFSGSIPKISLPNVDQVILFSNLLDNSIEACSHIEGTKIISIFSTFRADMWIFSISNPVKNNIVIHNNFVETTKNNKEVHGFGLRNISRVISNYDGTLKLTCEDLTFTGKFTIPLANK